MQHLLSSIAEMVFFLEDVIFLSSLSTSLHQVTAKIYNLIALMAC